MFTVVQIIISIFLTALVLLQPNDPGMSQSIGGTSHTHTRRGSEKFLFRLTIISAVAFVISSIANLLIA